MKIAFQASKEVLSTNSVSKVCTKLTKRKINKKEKRRGKKKKQRRNWQCKLKMEIHLFIRIHRSRMTLQIQWNGRKSRECINVNEF